jgi:hypothetical protein
VQGLGRKALQVDPFAHIEKFYSDWPHTGILDPALGIMGAPVIAGVVFIVYSIGIKEE